mmetsp:Transcript_34113/g.61501  ORF Transcript_34113/g.61501 Transcript_34113/m.61501 type:complete len:286 (-) Transcript_34113:196-1053(-)|eukprot:CAMPEP_0175046122 /NCGR_PEP_ID=MMETSP0052_2-20121109/4845_1 /TAXON_ID=51329 ORGANISM="Polytomella parva, Strain SAG 63-3" /NCGR_SAMPLE_ID=MMETSP0052_2 /ASSEMBLY_ACC=CAM_ASM_000194 /LENGTH=285 /DNA_ID=CAMNT_0016309813 /DNA_START=31 /DNA_END=888 /DNA_ORIENTATION=-
MSSINLLPFSNISSVKVSPVVVLSICDAYLRRKENSSRVIGSLLGTYSDGVVEIKSCFPVPITEASGENGLAEVKLDVSYHKTMLDLRSKVSPSEMFVGWFASQIDVRDSIIQDVYIRDGYNPLLYMVVDVTLDERGVSAFVARRLMLDGKLMAMEFVGVPTQVTTSDLRRVEALFPENTSVVANSVPAAAPATPALSKVKLLELLHTALVHVEAVQSGGRVADPEAGRALADALSLLPVLTRADFDRLAEAQVQDALFLTFLANLLRTQIALSEKLGTSALPIM